MSWRTFVFPVTKKNHSQIKYRSEKNTSETAHILDQDNKQLNSEKNTKFEEKYNELEKRIVMKSASEGKAKEDKKEKVETKKKKGNTAVDAQRSVNEAAAANPSRDKDTPLDVQTQWPKQSKVKGPQQQSLKEETKTLKQAQCDGKRLL